MNCEKCDTAMFQANMVDGGHMGLPILLTSIKKGLLDPQKASSLKCLVCPSCGKIELYADDPQTIWTP